MFHIDVMLFQILFLFIDSWSSGLVFCLGFVFLAKSCNWHFGCTLCMGVSPSQPGIHLALNPVPTGGEFHLVDK